MNLHDIVDRPAPRYGFSEWREQMRSAFGTLGATRNAAYRDYVLGEFPQPRRDWFAGNDAPRADVPRPEFYIQHPRGRATDLLADIYRFRDRMLRAGLRQRDIEDHLAYLVSPQDYRVLQAYVPQEGWYLGPVYDRDRGTMSVMGITVLPSR